jgi:hypothetical protein
MSRQYCKFHIIGQYYWKGNLINFCIGSDVPEDAGDYIFYQNCPMCGEKITEQIKTRQLEYNINVEQVDVRPDRRRKKKREFKQKERIPKRKSRIPKRKKRRDA